LNWPLVKTAIFIAVVPGTVAILIPQRLRWQGPAVDHVPQAIQALGMLLFVLGVAISLWCAWDFAMKGKGTPLPIDAPRLLVVNGLYRYTRNPMYVGVASLIFGQAIFNYSGSIAVYGCAVITAFYLFVRLYEEPTLRRTFGQQYEDYCRRVPRWLPRFRGA
jgi:protein-S-isoprenylcysteine O-methyltransferase Ste14